MTRMEQLRVIRQCLKMLGINGVRILDCCTLQGVNNNYRNNFWGVNIDTFFLCEERKLDIDDKAKKALGIDQDCYCVEYDDYYVYFNASAYMQYAIDHKPDNTQSRIRNIIKMNSYVTAK